MILDVQTGHFRYSMPPFSCFIVFRQSDPVSPGAPPSFEPIIQSPDNTNEHEAGEMITDISNPNTSEKSPKQDQFVHHKSRMVCPGAEHGFVT